MANTVTAHSEPATHGVGLRSDRFSTLSSPNVASARPASSSMKTSDSLIDAKRLVADRDSLRGITSPEAPKKAHGKMVVEETTERKPMKLTKQQRRCIEALEIAPHLGPGELATILGTSQEGAAATASSLVRKGLVERRTDLGSSGRLVRYRRLR